MNEQQAREAVIQYRDSSGKSQEIISKELGISSGLLCAFIKGTYKTPHTVIPKIEALIEKQESRKQAPKEPPFAETTVSKQVMDAIEYCNLLGKIGVVYGDAGIGKTMGVLQYCKKNPMSIFITIVPVFNSISGVNDLLSEQIGIKERNARRFYRELVNRLASSKRIIIIDEAQHLTEKTLDYLRGIWDATKIGMCFVGNEEVYNRLRGSGKADFAQNFSRIAMRSQVFLESVKREDIEKIFFEAGLDESTMDFLYKIAKTRYGIRGAVNTYVAAAALFGKVDSSAIVRVAREMNIG